MESSKDKFHKWIRRLYRFFYKGCSSVPKKSAWESLSSFLIIVLFVISTFLLTLLFKIGTLFGIYFKDRTIIFTILGFLIIDFLIATLMYKYIKRENIITDEYVGDLEKEAKKESSSHTFLNFWKGFFLNFFLFCLWALIYFVMVKILGVKSIA